MRYHDDVKGWLVDNYFAEWENKFEPFDLQIKTEAEAKKLYGILFEELETERGQYSPIARHLFDRLKALVGGGVLI